MMYRPIYCICVYIYQYIYHYNVFYHIHSRLYRVLTAVYMLSIYYVYIFVETFSGL